ncbi:MAG: UDP-glucose/GDP-mannose dehydrogenase family protein [Candidatus Omnitrophica bacterium]|nr:UDP-glucose/GDP-mannose dehydrogenase family protein [Candidatus Omnitrophota bacterium]
MKVAIIGAGHVGLVTGVCLASVGHRVYLVDVHAECLEAIRRGKPLFYEPQLEELLGQVLAQGRLETLADISQAVEKSELILLAVGTPLKEGSIDLRALRVVSEQVGAALKGLSSYRVVAVKSTVIPGTTDTTVRSLIEEHSKKTVGEFGLCMNPEFLREGSAIEDFLKPDRIVIGQQDERSGQVLDELYRSFSCPKVFTTLRNAELIKYASNALLANLVSFSNEMAALCEAIPGTNVETILAGLRLDRRLSIRMDGKNYEAGIGEYLKAGCGFGGSCLPKDVAALKHFAAGYSVSMPLLDAVLSVNRQRPSQLVAIAEKALGVLKNARATVLGLAFKPGTDDLRESPALAVIEQLLQRGAEVKAFDPFVRKVKDGWLDGRVALCESPQEALSGADAALVVTAWPEFARWDWKTLASSMRRPILIDGRNGLRQTALPETMRYFSIGKNAST